MQSTSPPQGSRWEPQEQISSAAQTEDMPQSPHPEQQPPPCAPPNAHRIVREAVHRVPSAPPHPNAVIPPLLIKLWRESGKHRHTWWQAHPALWQDRVYPAPLGWPVWQDPFPIPEQATKKQEEDEELSGMTRPSRIGSVRAKVKDISNKEKSAHVKKETLGSKKENVGAKKENVVVNAIPLPKRDPPLRNFEAEKREAERRDDQAAAVTAARRKGMFETKLANLKAELAEKDDEDDDFITSEGGPTVIVREVVNDEEQGKGGRAAVP